MASKKSALPMPKFHKNELNLGLRSVAVWLAPLVRTLFGLRVTGMEKLPKTGPYVLVANHMTNVDPLAVAYFVYAKLGRAPHFLAKEGLSVSLMITTAPGEQYILPLFHRFTLICFTPVGESLSLTKVVNNGS